MKRKKYKLKLDTRKKSYCLKDSCFYRLRSKNKLSRILRVELADLKSLTHDENYNCFLEVGGRKPRQIQSPFHDLNKVHTRIASLLCRISLPDYIYSGVKGRTHIQNAKVHVGNHKVLVSDIKAFYPSTTKRMVFEFFFKRLECSSDVADLLADLCTYEDHIPTGSRISMPLAFWSSSRMFDSLQDISRKNRVNFSVFVDDITFSGNSLDYKFLFNVKEILKEYGHIAHPLKTKLYPKNSTKLITGVAVDDDIHVANKHKVKIYEDISQWRASVMDGVQFKSTNQRLLGRMSAQGQVELKFKDKLRSLKSEISKLNNNPDVLFIN
jgi:hypothetical protein